VPDYGYDAISSSPIPARRRIFAVSMTVLPWHQAQWSGAPHVCLTRPRRMAPTGHRQQMAAMTLFAVRPPRQWRYYLDDFRARQNCIPTLCRLHDHLPFHPRGCSRTRQHRKSAPSPTSTAVRSYLDGATSCAGPDLARQATSAPMSATSTCTRTFWQFRMAARTGHGPIRGPRRKLTPYLPGHCQTDGNQVGFSRSFARSILPDLLAYCPDECARPDPGDQDRDPNAN